MDDWTGGSYELQVTDGEVTSCVSSSFPLPGICSGAVGIIGEAPPRIARCAALETEWQALDAGAAIVDRSYRALLEVTGADRATWLHNLTTSARPTRPPERS